MNLPSLIARYMSLREPQKDSLAVLHEISDGLDYRSVRLDAVAAKASEMSRAARPVKFDTSFPSFCFALATGVGKTRLMGACIYYLWKAKGYRNFFILAPGMTIYDKLRQEADVGHTKSMFKGLGAEFPKPEVYDGDSYPRFRPSLFDESQINLFVFNIGKIFSPRTDRQFKFHKVNEYLGAAFSEMLQQMGDLVVLMDESHRYRGKASLEAVGFLKPALGLEFTATPKHRDNVIYEFGLAQAIGRYVKTPTVVTRTNLTKSDEAEMERLKLMDGMTRHEMKKARLAEYCSAVQCEPVKPFVLISTRDTVHAAGVRALVESDGFYDGRYKGKVIEIHSGKTGAESEDNIARLLAVEYANSDVEVVIHVNMLKEGWDVKNLYTIIPLRPTRTDELVNQTMGRGLRLPFGKLTGDADIDELEIVYHDRYSEIIAESKGLIGHREYTESDLRPVKTVTVQHGFVDLDKVLDRVQALDSGLFAGDLPVADRIGAVVDTIVREAAEAHAARAAATAAGRPTEAASQAELFELPGIARPEKDFDREKVRAALTERLTRFFDREAIRVPRIEMEVVTELKLRPFAVRVNRGPYSLVDQRIQIAELQSGEVRSGDTVQVLSVDNPHGFLAGKLIDAIEEMDVGTDKELALSLVDEYVAGMLVSDEDLPKLVHLYRDTIIEDLSGQVEANLVERTEEKRIVRSGFIKFRAGTKAVLRDGGIRHYRDNVPREEIRRYAFEGYGKTIYELVTFDSTPEKDFTVVLETDEEVLKWVRPPDGNFPIRVGGGYYNPDFVVETENRKYIIEVKRRKDLEPRMDDGVRRKALAAIKWCAVATEVPNSKPWEYKLLPDDTIKQGRSFRFLIGQAFKV